jgi:cytochrome P450
MQVLETDLYDPDLYLEGPPHALFAELREKSPVYRYEGPSGPPFWAVTRHADVREVARTPELFSCREKGVQIETPPPDQLEIARGMLTNMDPPRHACFRDPLMAAFTPGKVARLEGRIREIARQVLVRARDLMEEQGEVEFVHQVCSPLPTHVFGELAGLPKDAWGPLHDMAARLTRSQDPDVVTSEEEKRSAGFDMVSYSVEFGLRRRAEPARDDLTSLILDTAFDGAYLSDADFGIFFSQFVVAGNETTVTLLSSGLQTLLDHPEQLAALRADPSLLPGAIEEVLRFSNPLHYLARTAMRDMEFGGAPIRKGDRVAMYYTSANRDEAVFDKARNFDIRRYPNPHVSLGYANHFCMGAHLARLEARVFFEELFAMFPRIEAAGPARRLRSNFNNALKQFSVFLGS